MVNESSIKVPEGIDISRLNIALEIMWLNKLYKEGYINQDEYLKVLFKIKIKYT